MLKMFARSAPKVSSQDQREVAEAESLRLATVAERYTNLRLKPEPDLADDPLSAALARLASLRRNDVVVGRLAVSALSHEASETAINVGWTSHDVSEIASSTQSIASAVEEMATSITEVSQNSQATDRSADELMELMRNCTSDVAQAQQAMQSIEARTHRIDERLDVLQAAVGEIVKMAGTISTISSQTNLLALNATIEAARAGDAGRGFAVVASEVKALSNQTARTTEQIRAGLANLEAEMSQISQAVLESREGVSHGSVVVEALGCRVEAASECLVRTKELSCTLAAALEQQQATAGEISSSVQAIAEKANKTTGEIGAITERLLRAEGMALAHLRETDALLPEPMPSRLAADVGVWKRGMANILLGAAPADRTAAEIGDRAAIVLGEADPAAVAADVPSRDRLTAALAKAADRAREMIDAIAGKDWAKGAPAFEVASKAGDLVVEEAAAACRAA